jgi:hypothetical protein
MSYLVPAAPRCGRRSGCAKRSRFAQAFAGSLAVCFAFFLSTASSFVDAASPDLIDSSTYDDAVRNIPFDRMTDEAQGRLWKIVAQPSLYRRLPITKVETDPELYVFLIRYPEVIVNMWDLMGVTKVKIRRTGEFTFDASDGAGTVSKVELIYGDRETHVMMADGTYEGPLFKRLIRGRCVLVLRSAYGRSADKENQVTHQLDMFVQMDNVGADLIAKTLHPLVGQTADHNFIEASRFLGQVSQAATTRPTGMQQLASRLTKIDPTVRERFGTVSAEVYQRASGNLSQAKRPESSPMRMTKSQ